MQPPDASKPADRLNEANAFYEVQAQNGSSSEWEIAAVTLINLGLGIREPRGGAISCTLSLIDLDPVTESMALEALDCPFRSRSS
jgi:hypothetical protein